MIITTTDFRNPIPDAVADGMAPFRLKRIDIYLDHDVDRNQDRVEACAVLLSGYTVSFLAIIDYEELSANPDYELDRVANELFKKFRYERFHYLPPDNIILGEN